MTDQPNVSAGADAAEHVPPASISPDDAGGAPAAAADKDLSSLLASFQPKSSAAAPAALGPTSKGPDAPKPQPTEPPKNLFADLKPIDWDARRRELQQTKEFEAVKQYVVADYEQKVAQSRAAHDEAAVKEIWSEHAETIDGLKNLPVDDVKRRVAMALQTDAALQAALKPRFSSPEAWQNAKAAMAKAVDRIVQQAVKENVRLNPENRILTEDRALVSQAVRGSTLVPPARKPVNVMQLSDQDAKAHVEKEFGYTPNY